MARRARLADMPRCPKHRREARGCCPRCIRIDPRPEQGVPCRSCGVGRAMHRGRCTACVDLERAASVARSRRRARLW
jgi:hypothetical protein